MSIPARRLTIAGAALALLASAAPAMAQGSDGWIPLFDGKTLAGWKVGANSATFRVENGEIVVNGPRAHLFYDGTVMRPELGDFELELDVLTRPRANSGVYLRTTYQADGWPSTGYEVQVNNSHSDWRRTGSLYGVQDVREGPPDDTWFTMRAVVRGRRVQVWVNGKQTVDYTEPADAPTRLTGATIALQGHDPRSEVHYRNIRLRRLP